MNTNFADVPWELLAPFILLNVILVVIALIDYFKRQKANDSTWLWIPFIMFVSFIGPISYFIFGRRS